MVAIIQHQKKNILVNAGSIPLETNQTDFLIKTKGDSLKEYLPVKPYALSFPKGIQGRAASGISKIFDLPITNINQLDDVWLSLGGGDSSILIKMRDRIYGGALYNKVTRLMIDISCWKLLLRDNYSETGPLEEEINSLIMEISAFRNYDGGYPWCKKSDVTDNRTTFLTALALFLANKNQFKVPESSLNDSYRFLETSFSKADDDNEKSYLLYIMGLYKPSDFSFANRLFRIKDQLNSKSLAFLSLAFRNMKKDSEALEAANELIKRKRTDSNAVYWVDTKSVYYSDRYITTAIVLNALQETSADSELLSQAANYLLNESADYFSADIALAFASQPLSTYLKTQQFSENNFKLTLLLNGQSAGQYQAFKKPLDIRQKLDKNLLKAGKNSLQIQIDGKGSYSYSINTKLLQRNFKQLKSLRKMDRIYDYPEMVLFGKKIKRGYSIISANYKKVENPLTDLAQFDHFKVAVSIPSNPINDDYYIYEETIPAGCRVDQDTIKGDFRYYEVIGNKIMFYFRKNSYYNQYISYELTAFLPGVYHVLPSITYGCYNAEAYTISEEETITIHEENYDTFKKYQRTPDEIYETAVLYYQNRRFYHEKSNFF